ncbi:DUF2141 domain-containing protein [Faecalibacter rhinopitheci]|uniref:DUF2141 domain-containing protein n=1 Tax=Faecalibacter rhinopitheci TaxID=2779678 RepID=A0A8J7FWE6_9FLAO|nr:DUF2141 domain-containing protein [Faecalibacter rhinopitheci]MBF0597821.1 DUF2141 domain-containing protein [Faecalibacter rhinopitheci]MBQ0147431.1 DUF2141 domain-containing protein [Candidatus Onthonaster equi]
MRYFLLVLSFFLCHTINAQTDVKLTIKNLRKVEGNLSIEFYRNIENYTKGENAFKKLYIPIKDLDQFETTFKNIEETYYAVKVFVDTNNNKILDKSFLGVKKEPYGYSGDSSPFLREPTFEEARELPSKQNNNIIIFLKNNKGDD